LPRPSQEDIDGMSADHVYFIIAINNNRKTRIWSENRDGTVSGTVGNFSFKIAAYYLAEPSLLRKVKIHCPFPPSF